MYASMRNMAKRFHVSHVHARTHTCTHAHAHARTHTHTNARTHTHTNACTRTRTHATHLSKLPGCRRFVQHQLRSGCHPRDNRLGRRHSLPRELCARLAIGAQKRRVLERLGKLESIGNFLSRRQLSVARNGRNGNAEGLGSGIVGQNESVDYE
jgi:hypothetical protein